MSSRGSFGEMNDGKEIGQIGFCLVPSTPCGPECVCVYLCMCIYMLMMH